MRSSFLLRQAIWVAAPSHQALLNSPSLYVPGPILPPLLNAPPLAEALGVTSLTALRSGALEALSRRRTFLAPSATACSTLKWCLSSSIRSSTAPRSGPPRGMGHVTVRHPSD